MKQKLNNLTYLIAGIIALNLWLIWRTERPVDLHSLKAIEAKADQMLLEVEESKKEIARYHDLIESARDTIKIIEKQRTINHTNYVTEISDILRSDTTQQFRSYARNSARFDSLLFAGFFFTSYSR
jgi:hypothetical protein